MNPPSSAPSSEGGTRRITGPGDELERTRVTPPEARQSGGGNRGVTLVELVVAVAVTVLLVTALVGLIVGVIRVTRFQHARNRMQRELTLALNMIRRDLHTLARNPSIGGRAPFELVGIDGDERFESSTRIPHADLDNPGDISDRLHVHRLASGERYRSSWVSERTYTAYWVNGEGSPRVKSEFRGRWGLLRRNRRHTTPGSVVPTVGSTLSPKLDLNSTSTDFRGVHPLVRHVDYLSFRYRDSRDAESPWRNCWNTTDRQPIDGGCDFPGTDRFPSAVAVAVRAYDPRLDRSTTPNQTVAPVWFWATVKIEPSS